MAGTTTSAPFDLIPDHVAELFRPPGAPEAISDLRQRIMREGAAFHTTFAISRPLFALAQYTEARFSEAEDGTSIVDFWRQRFPWIPPVGSSPVTKVPDEILAYVFELVVGDLDTSSMDIIGALVFVARHVASSEINRPRILPANPCPELLTRVCRRWRAIGLHHTPSIWSQIRFSGSLSPLRRRRFEHQLEHAGSYPLEISFEFRHSDSLKKSLQDLDGMLSLVAPHAARWRSLHVDLRQWRLLQRILHELSVIPRANLLQTLHLQVFDLQVDINRSIDAALLTGDLEARPALARIFPDTENLRLHTLSLNGAHLDFSDMRPFKHVRYLELARFLEEVHPTWAQFGEMITASPRLAHLVLQQVQPAGSESDWVVPKSQLDSRGKLPLPALTALELRSLDISFLVTFMDHVALPKLCSLLLNFAVVADTASVLHTLTIAPDSPLPHLIELEITYGTSWVAEDKDVARRFLARLVSLRKLTLQGMYSAEPEFPWMEVLCWQQNPAPDAVADMPCPKLLLLKLYYEEQATPVFKCLTGRIQRGFPIRKLVAPSMEFSASDRELLEQHMEIHAHDFTTDDRAELMMLVERYEKTD